MKICITGREGQVVRSFAERVAARPDIELVMLARPEVDLAVPGSVGAAVEATKPDLVVSAAAYTAVDQAEDEPVLPQRINADAVSEIAAAARAVGAPVIHLSTDYVFDGALDRAYVETDAVGPTSVYGATKLAGEEALGDGVVVRTAWIYSPFGKNFCRTMLRLAGDRDRVSVVSDQMGNPTSAHDIADALLAVVEHWRVQGSLPAGTYHFAGTGETSWYGFAREIMRVSRELGGPWAEVDPISSAQFPSKVKRPANSRLDSSKFAETFGYRAPAWQESLQRTVERLLRT